MTAIHIKVNLDKVVVRTCVRPVCRSRSNVDEHHITYNPPKTVFLCRPCHIGITALNSLVGAQLGKLSNRKRRAIWDWFKDCYWLMSDETYPVKDMKKLKRIGERPRWLLKLRKAYFGRLK